MEVISVYLNNVLSESARRNASALFLSAGNKPAMRIEGELVVLDNEEIITGEKMTSISENILDAEQLSEFKKSKEITIVRVFGNSFRFRVNFFYERGVPSVSFYYLNPSIKTLEELALPEKLVAAARSNHGLVIIAGAFGAGKTSIATAFIEDINKNQKKNIMTIEDPMEYVFINKKSIINQREVGSDVGSVVEALDYCLKEDVDVVYVNKIKDDFDEAMGRILELASGNSLVFLEMSAENATNILQRITSGSSKKFADDALRYTLADVLLGIIAQKLIPRKGGGQIAAREVLIASQPVKTLIREGKIFQLESVIQTSRQEGMISMSKSIEELKRVGEIGMDYVG